MAMALAGLTLTATSRGGEATAAPVAPSVGQLSPEETFGEATRLYRELRARGAPIRMFDVGGGMGVDYDGTATSAESSANYSVQEYANDVVYQLAEAELRTGQIDQDCDRLV